MEMPLCLDEVGSVRASSMYRLAFIAPDDQTFWPLTM